MNQIAESSGTAVLRDGERLLVVQRGTRHHYTAGFVLGLVFFILLMNVVASLAMSVQDSQWLIAGLVELLIAGVVAGMLRAVVRSVRRRQALLPPDVPIVCIIDTATRQVLTAQGDLLCQVDDAHLSHAYQFATSSPALLLKWPGGRLMLVRASPLAGGSSDVVYALRAVGFDEPTRPRLWRG